MLGEYLGAGSSTTKLLLHLNGNANDSSGNGNNGTPTNVSWVGGKLGSGSASLNGTTSRITIPNNNNLNPGTGNITYTFKVKDNNGGIDEQKGLLCKRLTSGNYTQISLLKGTVLFNGNTTSSKKLSFLLVGTNSTDQYNGYTNNDVFTDNTIKTISFIRDGLRSIKIYINGQEYTTTIVNNIGTNLDITNSSDLYIGNIGFLDSLSGNIDELIVEARDWTAEEVKKYYTFSQGKFIL